MPASSPILSSGRRPAIIAGLVALSVGVALAVSSGLSGAVDEALLLAFRSVGDPAQALGPGWLPEAVRDVTALGSNTVLIMATLVAAALLAAARRPRAAAVALGAVAGAFVLSYALKWGFDRPRPDLVPHGAAVFSRSFPSSHALLSTAVYLTLAAVAGAGRRAAEKAVLLGAATAVAVAVGLSRLYLGVHWPTDVVAGWLVGGAWALIFGTMAVRALEGAARDGR